MAQTEPNLPSQSTTSTSKPRRKVTVGILAGAIVVVIVWLLKLAKIDLPSEVAAALTTILSFIISYLTPPDPSETTVTDATGATKSALKSTNP